MNTFRNTKWISISLAVVVFGAACSSFKAERVDDTKADDAAMSITNNWVERDTQIVIDKGIKDIYAHEMFQDYLAKYQGKRIKLFIGDIRNNTSEAYFPVKDLEDELLNDLSNSKVFVLIDAERRQELLKEITYQNDGMVDPAQAKKIGLQSGADVIIYGDINMKPEQRGDKVLKEYTVNLHLTDIQTSEEVCRVREKVNKVSQGGGASW